MNGSEEEEPVLSRDELDALLERLSDKSTAATWAGCDN